MFSSNPVGREGSMEMMELTEYVVLRTEYGVLIVTLVRSSRGGRWDDPDRQSDLIVAFPFRHRDMKSISMADNSVLPTDTASVFARFARP